MPRPLSDEIREKIIRHKLNKVKEDDIAKWLIISKSAVTKTWALYQSTGSWKPLPANAGRKPAIDATGIEKIRAKISEDSDITLQELIDVFSLPVCQSALCRTLQKLGLTYKKRHSSQQTSSGKMSSKNAQNGRRIREH